MTIVYRPVLIESQEQADALPIGTLAIGPVRFDPISPMVRSDRYPGYTWHSDYTGAVTADEVVGWTALIPTEVEEEWGVVHDSQGSADICHDEEDAREWAAGFDADVSRRYVTGWEDLS